MSFFRQFPITTYDFGALIQNINVPRADQIRTRSGVKTNVVDLFRNATVNQGKLNEAIAYQFYRIQNGDRPDTVSQLLYRDPDYYWTFFVINNSLKSGLPAWPMSPGQLERYMAAEYDDYGVLVMSESLILTGIGYVDGNGTLNRPTLSDRTWWLSPKQIASRVGLNSGWSYSLNEAGVNQINALNGIDFSTNPNVCLREISSGALARIVKYDPDRNQLWIKKGTVGVISIASQAKNTGGPFSLFPRAVVSGGNGIGCLVEPILSSGSSGSITGLRLLEPGSGYISEFDGGVPIKVAIDETPAISAELAIYSDLYGRVGLRVTNPGAGYSRPPLVEVTHPILLGSTTVFPGLASFTAPFTGTSGSVTLTGSITSGSVTTATCTASPGATSLTISTNSGIVVGMAMYGAAGIPEGTRVTSVTSPTVIGISTEINLGGISSETVYFSHIAAGMNVTGQNIQAGSVVNSVIIYSLLNHIVVNISKPLYGNISSATLTFQRGIPGYGNIDVITPTGSTLIAGNLVGGNISVTGAPVTKINAISTPLPIPVASRTTINATFSSITGSSTIVVQLDNGLQAGQKAVGGNLGSITDGSVSVLSVGSPVVKSVPSAGSISPPDSGVGAPSAADTVRVNISTGNIPQISLLDYVSGANLYTDAIASGGLVGPFQVVGIDASNGRINIINRGGGNFTSGSVISSGSSLTFTRSYSKVVLATAGSYFSSAVTASATSPLLFYTATSTNLNLQTTGIPFPVPVVTTTSSGSALAPLSIADSSGNIITVGSIAVGILPTTGMTVDAFGRIVSDPVLVSVMPFISGVSAKFIQPKIELTVSAKIIDSSFIDRLTTFNPSDFPTQVPSTFTLETLNPNFTNLNPGSEFNLAASANYAWTVSYNDWRDGNSEKFISPAIPTANLIFSGSVVTYAPYATIDSARNAPYSYSDSGGRNVTAHDALAGNVAPVSTTLYADHELQLNDARANIRVVCAEDIRAFAQTYRTTINT